MSDSAFLAWYYSFLLAVLALGLTFFLPAMGWVALIAGSMCGLVLIAEWLQPLR